MSRPFSFSLTESEKMALIQAAENRGMSVQEYVNYALSVALEHNATGVYFYAVGGGHGASG